MAKKFIVETSARHVHLTDADLEVLFGKGAKLTRKDLSQPGQFACEERGSGRPQENHRSGEASSAPPVPIPRLRFP